MNISSVCAWEYAEILLPLQAASKTLGAAISYIKQGVSYKRIGKSLEFTEKTINLQTKKQPKEMEKKLIMPRMGLSINRLNTILSAMNPRHDEDEYDSYIKQNR